MPVARMQGEKWMPGRLSCLSLSRDQALCPRGPERDGSVALPSGGGLLAWAAGRCFAELVGRGRVLHPPLSGGLREVLWAPQATHVPSPGPGARRGGGPLPSRNTPFSSPTPMGNRGPTLQTHLTLSRQLLAPPRTSSPVLGDPASRLQDRGSHVAFRSAGGGQHPWGHLGCSELLP